MALEFDTSFPDSQNYLLTRLMVEEGITESVVALLRQIIPKSAELIKTFTPSLKDLDERAMVVKLNSNEYKGVLKAMTGFSFMTYMDTLVMVPEGFSGSLNNYLKALLAQGRLMAVKAPALLNDYTTELAMFLSNADIRMSLKSHESKYRQISEERRDYEKSIKTYFDPKFPSRSRLPIGDLLSRFSDLEEVFHLSEQLAALRKDMKFSVIAEEVKKASDMLGLIKYRLDSNEIENVSGQVAKNLSLGAFEVAEYVESVAVFGYHAESAVSSVMNISKQLTDLFKIRK